MIKILLFSVSFIIIKCAVIENSETQLEQKLKKLISEKNLEISKEAGYARATNGSHTSQLVSRPSSGPCTCLRGQCGCCTGSLLALIGQRACMNLTYEPDDFAFTGALSVNEKVLYKNRISGKNPPPMCIRLPRLRAVRVCVRLSNIYFQGGNMHTCVDLEASFQEVSVFDTAFDCIRLGVSGVQSIGPEDGGGIVSAEEGDEDIEDYDDSAK